MEDSDFTLTRQVDQGVTREAIEAVLSNYAGAVTLVAFEDGTATFSLQAWDVFYAGEFVENILIQADLFQFVDKTVMHFCGTIDSEECMGATLPDTRQIRVECAVFDMAPEELRKDPLYWLALWIGGAFLPNEDDGPSSVQVWDEHGTLLRPDAPVEEIAAAWRARRLTYLQEQAEQRRLTAHSTRPRRAPRPARRV